MRIRHVFPALAIVAYTLPLHAQQADPEGIAFFEQKIRPALVAHCYACHSQEAATSGKLKAELFLDSREGVSKGGESGPVVVANKSQESRLIKALRYDGYEMP